MDCEPTRLEKAAITMAEIVTERIFSVETMYEVFSFGILRFQREKSLFVSRDVISNDELSLFVLFHFISFRVCSVLLVLGKKTCEAQKWERETYLESLSFYSCFLVFVPCQMLYVFLSLS